MRTEEGALVLQVLVPAHPRRASALLEATGRASNTCASSNNTQETGSLKVNFYFSGKTKNVILFEEPSDSGRNEWDADGRRDEMGMNHYDDNAHTHLT